MMILTPLNSIDEGDLEFRLAPSQKHNFNKIILLFILYLFYFSWRLGLWKRS